MGNPNVIDWRELETLMNDIIEVNGTSKYWDIKETLIANGIPKEDLEATLKAMQSMKMGDFLQAGNITLTKTLLGYLEAGEYIYTLEKKIIALQKTINKLQKKSFWKTLFKSIKKYLN